MSNNSKKNDRVLVYTNTCELKPKQNSTNTIYHHTLFIRKQVENTICALHKKKQKNDDLKHNISWRHTMCQVYLAIDIYTHWDFKRTPWGNYYAYFINKEAEAQWA